MLLSPRLGSKVRKQVLRLAGEIEHAECDSDLPVVQLVAERFLVNQYFSVTQGIIHKDNQFWGHFFRTELTFIISCIIMRVPLVFQL